MKVKLYRKKITGNRVSLYLDYYPAYFNQHTGQYSRRETLKLYLYADTQFEEKNSIGKNGKKRKCITEVLDKNNKPKKRKLQEFENIHNINTLAIAQRLQSERQIEVQNEIFNLPNKTKQNYNFIQFYKELSENKNDSSTQNTWHSSLLYLSDFAGTKTLMKDITIEFCNNYRHYLINASQLKNKNKKLARSTTATYFVKFQTTLKEAYNNGYLIKNINPHLHSIDAGTSYKQNLTIEELQVLVDAPFKCNLTKRVLIFAGVTGLRYGDIKKMTWSEIRDNREGYSYEFIPEKTGRPEYIPFNEVAKLLMGQKKDPDIKVFEGIKYSDSRNKAIHKWIEENGIDKKIGWHNFRHSFSTILDDLGVYESTYSRLLTHGRNNRAFKQTAHYTHPSQSKLREATNLIKLDLSSIVNCDKQKSSKKQIIIASIDTTVPLTNQLQIAF